MAAAAPDWILASVGAKPGGRPASLAPASGGGLDWLAHAVEPQADVALSATAGKMRAPVRGGETSFSQKRQGETRWRR